MHLYEGNTARSGGKRQPDGESSKAWLDPAQTSAHGGEEASAALSLQLQLLRASRALVRLWLAGVCYNCEGE
jgi:hypothetical protein